MYSIQSAFLQVKKNLFSSLSVHRFNHRYGMKGIIDERNIKYLVKAKHSLVPSRLKIKSPGVFRKKFNYLTVLQRGPRIRNEDVRRDTAAGQASIILRIVRLN